MAGFNPTTYYEGTPLYTNSGLYDGFRYPGPNDSDWKIELAVDLSANGVGDWFTLDDPVKGVLDNATYLLAGDVLIDITRWVRAVSVNRGKSRRLQKFTAGTCSFTLDNRDRLFDPLMAGSPLYGSIVPRKEVRVSYRGQRVFTGNVEDWDFGYNVNGDSVAIPSSADALSFLARRTYPAATETAESAYARVGNVLDAISWPDDARVFVGNIFDSAALYADTHDDVSALQYLQQVELSDIGMLFANKAGAIEYHVGLQDPWTPTYQATFGEGGIPFFGIQVAYETDVMSNAVTCNYNVSSTYTASDATSQATYGMLASSYDTLLATSPAGIGFAESYLAALKDPQYYISELSVNMLGIPSAFVPTVLALELGDAVQVIYRPNNTGEVQTYSLLVEGIAHDANPNSHVVTFKMAPPIPVVIIPV